MRWRIGLNERSRRVGESHPLAKLSDHDVELVHTMLDAGMSYQRVADKMDVSKSCIAHIAQGYRRAERPVRWVSLKV